MLLPPKLAGSADAAADRARQAAYAADQDHTLAVRKFDAALAELTENIKLYEQTIVLQSAPDPRILDVYRRRQDESLDALLDAVLRRRDTVAAKVTAQRAVKTLTTP